MAVLLGIATAILLGSSDFWAARAARTTPSVTVTRSAVLVSVVLSPLLLLVTPSAWILRDAVIGGLAGLTMITGLLMLYRGYSVARMGIVAPMSSVLLGAVPVLYDAIRGERPGLVAAIGIGVGLCALVLTSWLPGGHGSASIGIVLGIASGVAFGVAFTLLGSASSASGMVPIVMQRITGLLLLSVLHFVGSEPFFAPEREGRRAVVAAAVFATAAMGVLQLGFQRGSSGPVSVAASQFATVAVILSVVFNRERMRWWQAVGVAASAVGVALMALGG
jgi:drug/metabolite transporter (DMT)-like permease